MYRRLPDVVPVILYHGTERWRPSLETALDVIIDAAEKHQVLEKPGL